MSRDSKGIVPYPISSLTPRHIVASLACEVCPICGLDKLSNHILCYRCWHALDEHDKSMLRASRIGEGFDLVFLSMVATFGDEIYIERLDFPIV